MNESDVSLVNCATIHTIIRDKRYFLDLTLTNVNVSTISGTANLIEDFEGANIMLSNRTSFFINDSLYYSKSTRNLLSFKDIRKNGYYIETMNEGSKECFHITYIVSGKKLVMKKLSSFSSRLHHTNIKSIKSYVVLNQKFNDTKTFILRHDKMSHLGSPMIRIIIEHSHEHPLKNQKILFPNENPCAVCSQGKLIVIPSLAKSHLSH